MSSGQKMAAQLRQSPSEKPLSRLLQDLAKKRLLTRRYAMPRSLPPRRSKKTLGGGFRFTDDPTAPTMRLDEENVLKEFSLDYPTLSRENQKTKLEAGKRRSFKSPKVSWHTSRTSGKPRIHNKIRSGRDNDKHYKVERKPLNGGTGNR